MHVCANACNLARYTNRVYSNNNGEVIEVITWGSKVWAYAAQKRTATERRREGEKERRREGEKERRREEERSSVR